MGARTDHATGTMASGGAHGASTTAASAALPTRRSASGSGGRPARRRSQAPKAVTGAGRPARAAATAPRRREGAAPGERRPWRVREPSRAATLSENQDDHRRPGEAEGRWPSQALPSGQQRHPPRAEGVEAHARRRGRPSRPATAAGSGPRRSSLMPSNRANSSGAADRTTALVRACDAQCPPFGAELEALAQGGRHAVDRPRRRDCPRRSPEPWPWPRDRVPGSSCRGSNRRAPPPSAVRGRRRAPTRRARARGDRMWPDRPHPAPPGATIQSAGPRRAAPAPAAAGRVA